MSTQRKLIRIIHLVGAAAIGAYVYSPYGELEWFTRAMQIGGIPILTISGLWLWKPKWFSFQSGAKVMVMSLIAGSALLNPAASSAQEPEPKITWRGGTGSFYIGFKSFDATNLDFFLPTGASSFGSGLRQLGGDGYFLVNKLVIGGGGHYTRGDHFSFDGNRYGINGGGGYLTLGYQIWQKQGFILFPYTNIGLEALSVDKELEADVLFAENQYTAMNYGVVSPTLDLGIGTDWFPLSKGFKVGLRVGYQFALNQSPEWYHTTGHTVDSPEIPELGLDGLYLRLNIGGGYIK